MGAPIKIMANGHAEKFQFQLEGDETVYSVPYIGSLDTSTTYDMIAAAKGGDNDALMWFIEKFREWCPGLDERATIDQFGYIIGAWRAAGRDAQGVDAGESVASSS